MTEHVQFRIATTVKYRFLHGMTPEYLSELCFPVNQRPSRYQLQSSQSNQLTVPRVKLSTMDLVRLLLLDLATIWNNRPEYLSELRYQVRDNQDINSGHHRVIN